MIENWKPVGFILYTSIWKPNEGPRPNKDWLRDKLMNDVNNDVTKRAQTPNGERCLIRRLLLRTADNWETLEQAKTKC